MAKVTIDQGHVRGAHEGDHLSFRGIPFGIAPAGGRRFKAPEPHGPWAGTLEAVSFGAAAIQGASAVPGMAAEGEKNEDCLTLNVFTPAADDGARPVMVWIHGGGFTLGTAGTALYDGGRLAERGDVVVVTLNYRLGAFGYLYLGAHGGGAWGAVPNCGQRDQILALRWVRDNIASFGGDPGNVTVFGESAGASAIATLLAMPEAVGLFHKAILESGSGANILRPEEASQVATTFLRALGLERAEQARLQGAAAEEILAAQQAVQGSREGGMRRGLGFSPVIDGESVDRNPLASVAAGGVRNIPLLIGTNRDEVRLFTRIANPNPEPIPDETLLGRVREILPEGAADHAGALVAAYRKAREGRLPDDNNDILDAITGDARFLMPAIEMAAAQASHQPKTFMYLFTWESPARRGALGAAHAVELPFVFGTLDAPGQDRFGGSGPEAERLSGQVMDAWLAFARTGDPSHSGIGRWDSYDAARRATMVLGRESRLEEAPQDDIRKAWSPLVDTMWPADKPKIKASAE